MFLSLHFLLPQPCPHPNPFNSFPGHRRPPRDIWRPKWHLIRGRQRPRAAGDGGAGDEPRLAREHPLLRGVSRGSLAGMRPQVGLGKSTGRGALNEHARRGLPPGAKVPIPGWKGQQACRQVSIQPKKWANDGGEHKCNYFPQLSGKVMILD